MTTAEITKSSPTGAATDCQSELWGTANALRGIHAAAGYKYVVLGLIFLKHVSDAFEEVYSRTEPVRMPIQTCPSP